jgi:hypothetical protein
MVDLKLVETRQDIRMSFNTFSKEAPNDTTTTQSLLRSISYWVYDPDSNAFGPSKFVGFKDMTFVKYLNARDGNCKGARFNGTVTRQAIENILGQYSADTGLTEKLKEWGENICGFQVFKNIDQRKWKFLTF